MSGHAWMDQAACLGTDLELWFPDRGETAAAAAAIVICGGCPVRDQCLEYALREALNHGVFGGATPDQRRRIRAARGLKVRGWSGPLAPHGTPAAYRRHCRRGERPCQRCIDAEQIRHAPYAAARMAASRAAAQETRAG